MTMDWVWLLIGAYFFGSIPFGYLIARAHGIDITRVASGNIGATNVMRALGKGYGLLVFFLDVAKGYVPAALAHYAIQKPDFLPTSQEFAFVVGMAAVVGHCLSPFLRFKGGKGVATGLGAMLGATPWMALTVFGVFLVLLAITRYVSLSSILAVLTMPIFGVLYRDPPSLIIASGGLAAFIIYRHRGNIRKLREGTENKFTFGKKTGPQQPPSSSSEDAPKEDVERNTEVELPPETPAGKGLP
jgi:acyl phosphate:glycerol-3-phosphate acyltransferase